MFVVAVIIAAVLVAQLDALEDEKHCTVSPDLHMKCTERNYNALRYEQVILPDSVESSLVAMTERLGLSFAAADFVVTADGQHYFIDLNPGGQWAWIQEATGLPIAAAIADHLTGEDQ